MATQTEAQLEESLIARLLERGWERTHIADEAALLTNLKAQLEAHNNVALTEAEFARVLNHLD